MIPVIPPYVKVLAYVAIVIGSLFGAWATGWHMRGTHDLAGQVKGMQTAQKNVQALEKKQEPVIVTASQEKAASVESFKRSSAAMAAIHEPFMDAPLPPAVIDQWNRDARP